MKKERSLAGIWNETFTDAAQMLSGLKDDVLSHGKDKAKAWFDRHRQNLITFGILLLVSFLIFGYALVTHGFSVPMSGDGYLQEHTFPFVFWDYWHEYFETGNFPQWDISSALGTNNVGGNSFYSLFSPVMIVMALFPREWILPELGLRYVLCLTLGGYFFYLYLKSFKLSVNTRRIGGLAYAFCGWAIYNLWFLHFLDSFALFPLILYGVEKILNHKDPRLLMVALFLQGVTNYFFFVEFVIGSFIYAMWRFFTLLKTYPSAKEAWSVLGVGFMGFAFGCLAACVIVIPGILNAQLMPRLADSYVETLTTAFSQGNWSALFKAIFLFDNYHFKVLYPFSGFFFMANHDYSNNLVGPNFWDNASGSMFVFTPIMLLAFAGVLDGFRRKKVSYPLGAALITLIVSIPFFYYAFNGFTMAYARFLLIPSAWIIAFGTIQAQRIKEMPKKYMDASFAFIVLMQLTVGIYALYLIHENIAGSTNPNFDASTGWDYRFITVPLEIAYTFICYAILRHFMRDERGFRRNAAILIAIEAVVMGNVSIAIHGFGNFNNEEYAGHGNDIIQRETKIVEALKDYDSGIFRIQNATADRNAPNIPEVVGHNGISAFNSNYTFNAQDFLDWSRIPYTYHNWSMGAHQRRVNMETFLGVKYYLVADYDHNVPFGYQDVLSIDPTTVPEAERASFEALQQTVKDNLNVLYDREADGSKIARRLYVNQDYVDFAFPFDSVVNSSAFKESTYSDFNEYAYLRYGIIDDGASDDKTHPWKSHADFETAAKQYNIPTLSINNAFALTDTYNSILISLTDSGNNTYKGTLSFQDGSGNSAYRSYDVSFQKTDADAGFDLTSSEAGITIHSPAQTGGNGTYSGFSQFVDNAYVSQTDAGYDIRISNYSPLRRYSQTNTLSVQVRPADWGENNSSPYLLGYKEPFSYDSGASLKGMTFYTQIALTSLDNQGFAADASETNPYYVSIKTRDNIEWHFVTDRLLDGKTASDSDTVFDKIGKYAELPLEGLQSYSDYQDAHGYYVNQPIQFVYGVLKETKKASAAISRPELFTSAYGDYKMAVDKLNAEPITMIARNNDTADFKTHYSKAKFVVLNQPFEDGWALYEATASADGKRTLTPVDAYKAQGGFVGFFAPEGEHEYVLYYTTPGLNAGSKMAAAGLILGGFVFAWYWAKAKNNDMIRNRLMSLSYSDKVGGE